MSDKKKKKHLSLSERIEIEVGLTQKLSLKKIAMNLNRSTSTISREIRSHREAVQKGVYGKKFNDCANKKTCQKLGQCNKTTICDRTCSFCGKCIDYCKDYKKSVCDKLNKPPYVCNSCKHRNICPNERQYYHAKFADIKALETVSHSRSGIALEDHEIDYLNKVVSSGLKKGQSINHIYYSNLLSMPCCIKTIYNYINMDVLGDSKRIDLRSAVKRKPRKFKKDTKHKVEPKCTVNRSYKDFKAFKIDNPCAEVQIDSVEGIKGGKVLLTILFTNCNLQ